MHLKGFVRAEIWNTHGLSQQRTCTQKILDALFDFFFFAFQLFAFELKCIKYFLVLALVELVSVSFGSCWVEIGEREKK